jgi:hypothetical protein
MVLTLIVSAFISPWGDEALLAVRPSLTDVFWQLWDFGLVQIVLCGGVVGAVWRVGHFSTIGSYIFLSSAMTTSRYFWRFVETHATFGAWISDHNAVVTCTLWGVGLLASYMRAWRALNGGELSQRLA